MFKGKKMPGRMGTDRITVQNLKILKVIPSWLLFPNATTLTLLCLSFRASWTAVLAWFSCYFLIRNYTVPKTYLLATCANTVTLKVSCLFHGIYLLYRKAMGDGASNPPAARSTCPGVDAQVLRGVTLFLLSRERWERAYHGFVFPKYVLIVLFFSSPATRTPTDRFGARASIRQGPRAGSKRWIHPRHRRYQVSQPASRA